MSNKRPGVGLAAVIVNNQGQILVHKRIGKHAPKYSIPGGSLELGETFEAGAIREIQEECGITLINPKVIAVTNNLETFLEEGLHYISVIVLTNKYKGVPRIVEPDKHANLNWVDPNHLPKPHFDASRLAVECYLKGKFYVGVSS